MKLTDVFSVKKPIMGMLHLKGDGRGDVLSRAQREADLMAECGVDALVVEDYFGTEEDVLMVLDWLRKERPDYCYGVNILQQFAKSYETAVEYGAKFMQVDSVCGHLAPQDDPAYERLCRTYHERQEVLILGGVRFKYQKVLSGRSVEEDLRLGMERCDGIVVTGNGTGMNTDIEKIKQFRAAIGDFPLIIGAGLTAGTVGEQLAIGDGAIIGSAFKEGGDAHNELCRDNIAAFMKKVEELRKR